MLSAPPLLSCKPPCRRATVPRAETPPAPPPVSCLLAGSVKVSFDYMEGFIRDTLAAYAVPSGCISCLFTLQLALLSRACRHIHVTPPWLPPSCASAPFSSL